MITFSAVPRDPSTKKLLSLDDLYHPKTKIDFDGKPPQGLAWLDDYRYLVRQTNIDDTPLVVVHARTGNREALYSWKMMRNALASLPELNAGEAERLAQKATHLLTPDKHGALISRERDLFYYRFGDDNASHLAEGRDPTVPAEFSPDGRFVCYVKDANVHVVEIETRRVRALSNEGAGGILCGRLNWSYQEELYGRGNFKAYWWSPDSSRIAFLRLDSSASQVFPVIDYMRKIQRLEKTEYSIAGGHNPSVSLYVAQVDGTADAQLIDTSQYSKIDHLIVRVGWTLGGEHVAFQIQDREQTWLDLNLADPGSGKATRLLQETSPAWVKVVDNPHWLRDGTFLWRSDRSGWQHIYHYSANGELIRQVTSGDWEVCKLYGIDEDRDLLYFTATKHSAIGRYTYQIRFDGRNLRLLTCEPGTHESFFSTSFTHFIDYSSTAAHPTRVRLHEVFGNQLAVIHENECPKLPNYRLGETEFFQIESRDGFTMEAMMLRPPDFNPSVKYPVLLHTYGGPGTQKVLNAWGGTGWLWHQMLAQKGYIVWLCDNRSASGKGAASAWPVYRNLGPLELRDLEDGLSWLRSQSYVDPARIGIWGWSFGGFLTLYALTHSESFKMGIAGAPVTDWTLYDTIYTERYMSTPKNNPEGYEKSSILRSAPDLQGRLLLIHGMRDDNVHVQHSVQLIYELQRAGKQFDFMLYPTAHHHIEDPDQLYHLRTLMTAFVLENL